MVKVSRYHAGPLAVIPGRALFQGTSPAWLHPRPGLGVCSVQSQFIPVLDTWPWHCLCVPSSCLKSSSLAPNVYRYHHCPTNRTVSSAPALLKAHFHVHNSMPPVWVSLCTCHREGMTPRLLPYVGEWRFQDEGIRGRFWKAKGNVLKQGCRQPARSGSASWEQLPPRCAKDSSVTAPNLCGNLGQQQAAGKRIHVSHLPLSQRRRTRFVATLERRRSIEWAQALCRAAAPQVAQVQLNSHKVDPAHCSRSGQLAHTDLCPHQPHVPDCPKWHQGPVLKWTSPRKKHTSQPLSWTPFRWLSGSQHIHAEWHSLLPPRPQGLSKRGRQGYRQRGAVFQAAGVQHPRATLQGASLTGTESSKVSLMHHPKGTGIFPKLPSSPSTAHFTNIELQNGCGHYRTQLGSSLRTLWLQCWETSQVCSDPERDSEQGKKYSGQTKKKSMSSLKQSRVFSVTAMKTHFTEIPPCPSMCFTVFVVLQFTCTQLNSKVTLVFAHCSSTNHKGKSMWCWTWLASRQPRKGRKQEIKVKNMKAKALDTLSLPVPGLTMQMSEVASSVVMQASAQTLITYSMFIRTGGKPFERTR